MKGDAGMDQIKIGKFIAGKRKALEMTQKQLAEKLGMSDKSVSKWERGVCLPDVSVYQELCDTLGISITEFLAGEDIGREEIEKKAEDNLIQIATDSKHKQKRLKWIIAVLVAVAVLAFSLTGFLAYRAYRPQNVLIPLSKESVEMKTAELLSGLDGAYLYRYRTDGKYDTLTFYCTEYRKGELIQKSEMSSAHLEKETLTEGMLVLVPDYDRHFVRLVIADEISKLATEMPIFSEDGDIPYCRSFVSIDEETGIRYGEEQVLAALHFGSGEMWIPGLDETVQGNVPNTNDYVYVFSFCFK